MITDLINLHRSRHKLSLRTYSSREHLTMIETVETILSLITVLCASGVLLYTITRWSKFTRLRVHVPESAEKHEEPDKNTVEGFRQYIENRVLWEARLVAQVEYDRVLDVNEEV